MCIDKAIIFILGNSWKQRDQMKRERTSLYSDALVLCPLHFNLFFSLFLLCLNIGHAEFWNSHVKLLVKKTLSRISKINNIRIEKKKKGYLIAYLSKKKIYKKYQILNYNCINLYIGNLIRAKIRYFLKFYC